MLQNSLTLCYAFLNVSMSRSRLLLDRLCSSLIYVHVLSRLFLACIVSSCYAVSLLVMSFHCRLVASRKINYFLPSNSNYFKNFFTSSSPVTMTDETSSTTNLLQDNSPPPSSNDELPKLSTSMVDNLGNSSLDFLTTVQPLHGRFLFPNSDPAGTTGWTHMKWREQMQLSSFFPTDERALEEWVELNSPSISASSPSFRTLVSVLLSSSDESLRTHFEEASSTPTSTLEDFIDRLALQMFPKSELSSQLELEFLTTSRSDSTLLAIKNVLKQVRVYGYICRRRNRPSFLTPPFLIDTLLRAVPLVVEHRIKDLGLTPTTFEEARSTCTEAESLLKQRHGGLLPQPTTPKSYSTSTSITKPCWGCGEYHLRHECPHRHERCSHCGKLGHINSVCRTVVIQDNVGNPRVQITPSPSKVQAELKLDHTKVDHIRNVKNVAQGIENQLLDKSERAKVRKTTKKTSQASRPTAAMATQEKLDSTTTSIPRKTTSEPTEDSLFADYSDEEEDVCYITSQTSPVEPDPKKGTLQTSLLINGKPVRVILDSGSELDIICRATAEGSGTPS